MGYINETTTFDPGAEELKRGSIFSKLPMHMLVALGKSKFGLVAGITPSLTIAGGNDEQNDFELKTFDFSGDIGFNYRITTDKMTLLPEIKYSYSFIDAVVESNSVYSNAIDQYLRNRFTLTLIFIPKS